MLSENKSISFILTDDGKDANPSVALKSYILIELYGGN